MQVFFEDLACPTWCAPSWPRCPSGRAHRAGFSSDGTPNNLHVVRSMRGAIGRRIALGSESRRELRELERTAGLELLRAGRRPGAAAVEMPALEAASRAARAHRRIPYLDPIDLRYRNRVRCRCPPARR
jgi:uncharacterized sporulation protein YeaH/YhbH (DUF444 family)